MAAKHNHFPLESFLEALAKKLNDNIILITLGVEFPPGHVTYCQRKLACSKCKIKIS